MRLWYRDTSVRHNLALLWWEFKRTGVGSCGCFCGWNEPVIPWLWPARWWHGVMWKGHVQHECGRATL